MIGSRFKVSSIFEDAAAAAVALELELLLRVKNVIVYGPGLSKGVTGARNHFEIDMNTEACKNLQIFRNTLAKFHISHP